MVAGLEAVTGGTIAIGDRTVNHLPPAKRDIAMVFQSYALYPHKTVAQNMGFALKLRGADRARSTSGSRKAAEILDLDPYLDRYPRQLSGGQRQRVAMGRAIVRDPKVFLFDEPLSNLDAKLRVQMRTEIKELHQRLKTTTIYVTHDQIEAMTMADKIVVMQAGRIEQMGAPLDLFDRPANTFVAGFIGSPAMNLLKGKVEARRRARRRRCPARVRRAHRFRMGRRSSTAFAPSISRFAEDGLPARISVVEPTGSETTVVPAFRRERDRRAVSRAPRLQAGRHAPSSGRARTSCISSIRRAASGSDDSER